MKWCIWTGNAWEDWAPADIDEVGIGGSETAAVMVSRELAKLGHVVELYGRFKPDAEKTESFEGGGRFETIHLKQVVDVGQLDCDVFISSRNLDALMLQPKMRASGIWVHDINLGHDANDRLDKFDAIMVLSKWSAKTMEAYYPHIRRNRLFVTSNGLDLTRYAPSMSAFKILKGKAKPMKVVYSSSPDRGLDRLLDLWPTIRALEPGIELHVYYGFNTWRLMAKGMHQILNRVAWFEERMRRMAHEGVVHHGRVGQKELAQAQLDSTFWLYPTDFKETSCITAMEAMAAGAIPICTGLAALNETVGEHGVLIKPYNMEPRYADDFLNAIRRLLANPEDRHAMAAAARRHAMDNLSWRNVAMQWTEHFEKVIAEKEAKRP